MAAIGKSHASLVTACASTLFIGTALLSSASLAWAAWPSDPTVNLAICTSAHDQTNPKACSDGAGGVIITWQDDRSDGVSLDVYAQRVNLAGLVQWTANGVAVSTAAQDQLTPVIAADGAGGAIVAWEDFSVGPGTSIFAQLLNSSGAPQWTANGVSLSGSTGSGNPVIVSDGAGGAFVAWEVINTGPAYDVRLQHVTSSGAIASGWPADGLALTVASGDHLNPVICSDGAGGAIVAWQTGATIGTNDVFAQRVSAAGGSLWGASGVGVSAAVNAQYMPEIDADGSGGAVVVWQDTRNTTYDAYAQRLNSAGVAQWTAQGVAVCPGFHGLVSPSIVADGAGGAIVSWQDGRNASTGSDIYAQRLDGATGAPQWTAGGVALCNASGTQQFTTMTTDGLHGAIVTWNDMRFNNDVYAQRVSGAGTVQWTTDGAAISDASLYQESPTIVTNGAGGALLAWQDSRSLAGWDIYAQNVNADGSLGGTLVSVAPIAASVQLAVRPAFANPSTAGLVLEFSLPDDAPAVLEVFDLNGRRVDSEEVGTLGAGAHVITIARARALPPGVYGVRLEQGSRVALTKAVLLR